MSFTTCLFVAVGGAVGTLARYLVSVAALPISQNFPQGTLGINILGSFVIGFSGTLTLAHGRYPVSEMPDCLSWSVCAAGSPPFRRSACRLST